MDTSLVKYLTRSDVVRVEEALNANDLEVMLAVVDRIVKRRLDSARKQLDGSAKGEPHGTTR
jgi:hypothetical protein